MRTARHQLFASLRQMEASGLPIEQAFGMLMESVSAEDALAITALTQLLKKGRLLSEAAAESGLFREHEINLIRIGERTGRLEAAYAVLEEHYRTLDQRWQRLRGQLALPALVLIVGLLFLPLPAFTGGRIGLGEYLWPVVFAGALLIIGHRFLKHRSDAPLPDRLSALLLHVPGLRDLLHRQQEKVFCEHLAMALDAGFSLGEAVDMATDAVENPRVRQEFVTVNSLVQSGSTLHQALTHSTAINRQQGLPLIASGEAAGDLTTGVKHYAANLEATLEQQWGRIFRWVPWAAYAIVIAWLVL